MTEHERADHGGAPPPCYAPPRVVVLGSLAELTQKQVGAADGTQFLGVDLGT